MIKRKVSGPGRDPGTVKNSITNDVNDLHGNKYFAPIRTVFFGSKYSNISHQSIEGYPSILNRISISIRPVNNQSIYFKGQSIYFKNPLNGVGLYGW